MGRGRTARFEDGRQGFAVGDIHGRADLLSAMLTRLERERGAGVDRRPMLIFLGDYVDRGPDTADVIEQLLDIAGPGSEFEARFLMGNHEAAMLAFIDHPVPSRAWLVHGGLETMASYGVSPLPRLGDGHDAMRAAARRLRSMMPPAHIEFLRKLERMIVVGDYAFVHAGIDWARPITHQRDQDLLWARARFLVDKRRSSHVIVHGHTPAAEPYRDDRRIGLDTGAYASGKLCAASFWRDSVGFISVTAHDLTHALQW